MFRKPTVQRDEHITCSRPSAIAVSFRFTTSTDTWKTSSADDGSGRVPARRSSSQRQFSDVWGWIASGSTCHIEGLVVTSRGSCAPGFPIAYRRSGLAATSVAKHGERVTRKVLSQEIDQGSSQEQIRHDIEPQRTDADQEQDRSKDADLDLTSPAEDQ